MTAEAARGQAYRIFSAALDLPAGDRAAFARQECGADAALLVHVLRLLQIAHSDAAVTGALLKGADAPAIDRSGAEYGHFRLLRCLGTGGMGAVYSAERTDGVPQAVAVKLLRGAISAEGRARFLGEAKFLARLEHAAIARLIDVGIDARDGEAWIAMELVRGVPITEYCETHHLDLRARVRLLEVVIGAVAAAHRQLVVHRDIKPSNVLVGDDGQPKLIDFGIAAAVSEVGEPDAADSRRLFTPHYAAPEQVRGEAVTVATDVFGLGALAYRLLAGVEPYPAATSAVAYLLALGSGEAGTASEAARLNGAAHTARRLRGDLDAILSRALARDPAQRYPTAQELQGDFARYLARLPVRARPATLSYRLGRFLSRRAVAVSVAAVFVLALGVGAAMYARQQHQVAQAREAAARRGEFLEKLLKSADPREGRRDITVAELLDAAAADLPRSLGSEPLTQASMLGLIAETNSSLGRYPQGLAANGRQLALLEANGAGALEIALALTSRGELLRAWGHYAEAVPVLRRALTLLSPLKGAAAERAGALTELGMALANSGGEKEAEASFREAIAIDRRLGADRRAALGNTLDNLAVLLGNEGRYAESRDAAAEALKIQRSVLPPTHPELMSTQQTYAMTLLNMQDPKDAEPIQREIIKASAAVRGPEHPDTLVAQAQLGETLIDLQRYAEAQAVLRPAAMALERVQGPDNRYTTGTWSDYAIAACNGNSPADGLDAAYKVAQTRARVLPADDYHQAVSQVVIGLCLAHLHRYPEAEPVLLKATAALTAARGEGFYSTQLGLKALHWLYEQAGRPADARAVAVRIKD
jgi:serine/threonine-protein kinase